MSHFRKSYEVVGYAFNGGLLCVDCAGDREDCDKEGESSPVFLDQCEPGDYCDVCLVKWISERTDEEAKQRAPSWVFLDGEGPTNED